MQLLVRNKVADYARWVAVFRANREAGEAAGLVVEKLWRDAEDSNTAWFLLSVESKERAVAFMSAPDASDSAERSGVIDGEYHFLETADNG